MKNNLTDKDIEVLNKWAGKYDIDELKILKTSITVWYLLYVIIYIYINNSIKQRRKYNAKQFNR